MPNIIHDQPVRKILPIIYVIDTSASMDGKPIGAVNAAMGETIRVLQKIAKKNTDADIQVAAMTFDSDINWITNGLEDLEDYFWNDVKASGLTSLGAALKDLKTQMSRKQLFTNPIGFKLPIVIFMSDGAPTDGWEPALDDVFNNNRWFKHARKIAIAIGEYADKEVLAKVTGSSELVISVNDLDALEKLIVVLSATVSKIGSVSVTEGLEDTMRAVKETKKQLEGEDLPEDTDTSDDTKEFDSNDGNDGDGGNEDWPDDDWENA